MGLWISPLKKVPDDRPEAGTKWKKYRLVSIPPSPGGYWNHRISGKIPAKSGQQKT